MKKSFLFKLEQSKAGYGKSPLRGEAKKGLGKAKAEAFEKKIKCQECGMKKCSCK